MECDGLGVRYIASLTGAVGGRGAAGVNKTLPYIKSSSKGVCGIGGGGRFGFISKNEFLMFSFASSCCNIGRFGFISSTFCAYKKGIITSPASKILFQRLTITRF